jgi:hypothetical protein
MSARAVIVSFPFVTVLVVVVTVVPMVVAMTVVPVAVCGVRGMYVFTMGIPWIRVILVVVLTMLVVWSI